MACEPSCRTIRKPALKVTRLQALLHPRARHTCWRNCLRFSTCFFQGNEPAAKDGLRACSRGIVSDFPGRKNALIGRQTSWGRRVGKGFVCLRFWEIGWCLGLSGLGRFALEPGGLL